MKLWVTVLATVSYTHLDVYKRQAVHLVFSTLHAGGKFSESTYKTSAGLHGVGASVTNALSEWLDAVSYTHLGLILNMLVMFLALVFLLI